MLISSDIQYDFCEGKTWFLNITLIDLRLQKVKVTT